MKSLFVSPPPPFLLVPDLTPGSRDENQMEKSPTWVVGHSIGKGWEARDFFHLYTGEATVPLPSRKGRGEKLYFFEKRWKGS